jgi:hypothetical protein
VTKTKQAHANNHAQNVKVIHESNASGLSTYAFIIAPTQKPIRMEAMVMILAVFIAG